MQVPRTCSFAEVCTVHDSRANFFEFEEISGERRGERRKLGGGRRRRAEGGGCSATYGECASKPGGCTAQPAQSLQGRGSYCLPAHGTLLTTPLARSLAALASVHARSFAIQSSTRRPCVDIMQCLNVLVVAALLCVVAASFMS